VDRLRVADKQGRARNSLFNPFDFGTPAQAGVFLSLIRRQPLHPGDFLCPR
jgi:hypothetical protein